ncbi:MAG: hypothetical protein QM762_25530 [Chryseolinea sp.]
MMWRKFYTNLTAKVAWLICSGLVVLSGSEAVAQAAKSVVIGSMDERPNALLFLNPPSKNQGVLIPQLTTEQRLAMRPVSPMEDGLLLFDITDKFFYFWKDGNWVKGLGDQLTGSGLLTGMDAKGDLSGDYPAPKVSRLQGNAIAPGTLSGSDAGKVLVWNGTQWSPQVLPNGNTVSRYAMIDPAAFTNLRRKEKKDKVNVVMFDDNSTYVTILKKDEGSDIIAPLDLPDGAIIQDISLYYMDNEAKSLVFNVYRKIPMGGNEPVINAWTSGGNTPLIRMSGHTPVAGREVVDNGSYSYRIVIKMDQSRDVSDSDDATLRVYSVRIKYLAVN